MLRAPAVKVTNAVVPAAPLAVAAVMVGASGEESTSNDRVTAVPALKVALPAPEAEMVQVPIETRCTFPETMVHTVGVLEVKVGATPEVAEATGVKSAVALATGAG